MTEATSNNLNMKIAVLGLGCGGVRTLNALAALPAADKLADALKAEGGGYSVVCMWLTERIYHSLRKLSLRMDIRLLQCG